MITKKLVVASIVVFLLVFMVFSSALSTNLVLTGRLQSEYNTVKIEGISSQTSLEDPTFYSSWGFRISENLGNGFKAIGMIDWGFNPGSGSDIRAREQYVALANDSLGVLKIGRTHSPFADYAGGWTIDPFVYTALQAAGSGGTMIASANGLGSGPYTAVNSVIRFDSININGFSFATMLMPGDANRLEANLGGALGGLGNNPGNTGGPNGEWDMQAAAKYDFDFQTHRFNVFAGYSRDNVSSLQKSAPTYNLKTEEVGRAGGSWSYKDFRLNGQFEHVSNALGAATCSDAAALGAVGDATRQCNSAMNAGGNGTTWFTSGQYRWRNTTFIAQGGIADVHSTPVFESRKSESFTVGAFYDLSKRSNLFGGYQHVNVEDKNNTVDRDRNTWTIGMRHNF
jgi:predicted porin